MRSRTNNSVDEMMFNPVTDLVVSLFAIMALLFAFASGDKQIAQAQKAELHSTLQDTAMQLATLTTEKQTSDNRNAQQQHTITQNETDIQRLQTELERLTRDYKATEKQLQELGEQKQQQELKLARTLRALEKAESETTNLAHQFTQLLEEKETIHRKLAALKGMNQSGSAELVRSMEKIDELNKQLRQMQVADANRFAGVSLEGKKVLFLVDVSGSMRMWGETDPTEGKWNWVCQNVAKIMSSLKNASHYQVIVFNSEYAKKYHYPLGNAGNWLSYRPNSPQTVSTALQAIIPEGGTPMAPALAEAFQFRARGLDTIYLISDGLPNDPAGIREEQTGQQALGELLLTMLAQEWNNPRPGQSRVHINAVGFFFDDPNLGSFLWKLVRQNDGNFVGMSQPAEQKYRFRCNPLLSQSFSKENCHGQRYPVETNDAAVT